MDERRIFKNRVFMIVKLMFRKSEQYMIIKEIPVAGNLAGQDITMPLNLVVGNKTHALSSYIPKTYQFMCKCLYYDKENDVGYYFIEPTLQWK